MIYVGQALRIPGASAVAAAREPAVAILGDALRRAARRHALQHRAARRRVDGAARRGQPDRGALRGLCRPAAAHPGGGRGARSRRRRRRRRSPCSTPGKAPPLSGEGFLWPVNGKVIGGFGPTGSGQRRDGIDIAAREGAPVLAAEDGVVAYAGDGIRTLGRLILIRHAEGYITTYAHNAALLVDGRRCGRARPGDRPGRLERRRRRAVSCTSRSARAASRSTPRRSWCTSRPRSPAPSSGAGPRLMPADDGRG